MVEISREVFDLLISEAFSPNNAHLMVNKSLIKKLGLRKATILSYFVEKWRISQGADFECTLEEICENVGICDKTTRNSIHELIDLGVILSYGLQGNPPKVIYNIDPKKIAETALSGQNLKAGKNSTLPRAYVRTCAPASRNNNSEVYKENIYNIQEVQELYNKQNQVQEKQEKEKIKKENKKEKNKKESENESTRPLFSCLRTQKEVSIDAREQKNEGDQTLQPADQKPELQASTPTTQKPKSLEATTSKEIPFDSIPIPDIFEKKRYTKEEKFRQAIKDYRDFVVKYPECVVSESLWREWVESVLLTSKGKTTNSALSKQLKATIGFSKAYVEHKFDRAMQCCWLAPYLDKADEAKFLNASKSAIDRRKEVIKHGLSGISNYTASRANNNGVIMQVGKEYDFDGNEIDSNMKIIRTREEIIEEQRRNGIFT